MGKLRVLGMAIALVGFELACSMPNGSEPSTPVATTKPGSVLFNNLTKEALTLRAFASGNEVQLAVPSTASPFSHIEVSGLPGQQNLSLRVRSPSTEYRLVNGSLDAIFWISPLRSYQLDVSIDFFRQSSSYYWNWTLREDPSFEVSHIRITPGEGALTVTWTDPKMPDLDKVTVRTSSVLSSTVGSSATVAAGVQTATLTGLTPGEEYSVSFVVEYPEGNSRGTSANGWVRPPMFKKSGSRATSDVVALAVGDVTGDSQPDLLTVSGRTSFTLAAYVQSKAGIASSPTASIHTLATFTNSPTSIVLGDTDGDGISEILIGTDQQVEVYGMSTSNVLTLKSSISTTQGHKLHMVDLDGNGWIDLVGTSRITGDVGAWYQDEEGFGSEVSLYKGTVTGYNPGNGGTISSGDLNGDGLKDLVFLHDYFSSFSILSQTAPRVFAAAVNYGLGSWPARQSIAVGDLTGDGLDDVLIANDSHDYLALFPQQNGKIDSKPTYVATNSRPGDFVLADLNSDGNIDVTLRHPASSRVGVLLQSSGVLGKEKPFETSYTQAASNESVAVGDLNGDGKADIVSATDYGVDLLLQN